MEEEKTGAKLCRGEEARRNGPKPKEGGGWDQKHYVVLRKEKGEGPSSMAIVLICCPDSFEKRRGGTARGNIHCQHTTSEEEREEKITVLRVT